MARVLVVEDDAGIRLGLVRNLEFEGHVVFVAANGEEALRKALDERPDLIILDIMLPRLSGHEVCRLIRRAGSKVPVIFLSARGEEQDKVEGLRLGGDDYIAKPFGVKELLARVAAALRRAAIRDGTDEPLHFGPFVLDFQQRRLFRAGKEVEITDKEFTLLQFLVNNTERALSREAILREVWGYGYEGTARTIDNFITRLRRKLEDDPRQPRRIQTVRGHGYRFSAE
ncbi:MAG: response regulator transcription factor [Planctomycetes bacterium]|nr:response regulator transcription factor [Planctomycetota bacterium]